MVVVVYPPTVDHPASFFQAQEQFSVEQLVPEFPIERLNVNEMTEIWGFIFLSSNISATLNGYFDRIVFVLTH